MSGVSETFSLTFEVELLIDPDMAEVPEDAVPMTFSFTE
jgi:hypothetical protein